MNFVTLDFETVNFHRDSVCEVGITHVQDGAITSTKNWIVRPPYQNYNPMMMHMHQIHPVHFQDKPVFKDIWDEISVQLNNGIVLMHNASFDSGLLRKCVESFNLSPITFDFLCTYNLSKRAFPTLSNFNLPSVSNHIGFNGVHHRAGPDSLATAHIALAISNKLDLQDLKSVADALKICFGRFEEGKHTPSTFIREKIERPKVVIAGDPSKHDPESPLYGKSIVFTGVLMSMPRLEAQQLAADIGASLSNSVSKNTDFLVVGQQDFRVVGEDGLSRKQEKAIQLKQQGIEIEVLSEEQFLRMVIR